MYFKKPYKIRDSSDKDYHKLANDEDGRRTRADNIDREIIENWFKVISLIGIFILPLVLYFYSK